jgi:hypothetical protein
MNMKEAIIHCVESYNGIKDNDLALHVMGIINPVKFDSAEFEKELASLVDEDEIEEVRFIIPDTKLMKAIYLPKGTELL